ncbi:MAG: diguanylate cyclase (GGDEF)-like protein [Gammaproteobacteria bacterium]|jgi:diguanylate cyclase (GGDEF)-like protein
MQATLLLVSSVIIGLGLNAVHIYFVHADQQQYFQQQAREVLNLAEGGAINAAWTLDLKLADKVVRSVISKEGVKSAEIRVRLNSNIDDRFSFISVPSAEAGAFLNWVAKTFFSDISAAKRSLTIEQEGKQVQVGTLVVEFSRQYFAQNALDTIISSLALTLIEAFLFGLALLKIAEWLVTTPLRRAARTIAEIEPHQMEEGKVAIPVPELHRANELGQLLDYTNQFISRLAQSQNELRHLATRDSLTGLHNRSLICEYLETCITAAKRSSSLVGVVFLDLNRFKIINDSLGHDIGDKLLQSVAKSLSESIRASDAVGRLGGDEFLIVMEAEKISDVVTSVQRLVEVLSHPHRVDGLELRATASLGIATYPDDGSDAGVLMQRADLAMYKAKGDDIVPWRFFSEAMGVAVNKRLLLENALVGALERDEFELYLQPKFFAHDVSISGCEALLRWQFEGQWISPDDFIKIAEDMGLICDIGDWVLREACRMIKCWGDTAVPVSVNVSAGQLGDEGFVTRSIGIVEDRGINPEMIIFEITETMLMQDIRLSRKRLSMLRDRGFGISIDDFGTGYSSLAYLSQLPINELKIDRSFVSGPEYSKVILETIIALGRALDLSVVAEGVETKKQCDTLSTSGCDLLQGYYLARPMPLGEFETQFLKPRCA